jgi:hypothetical protein
LRKALKALSVALAVWWIPVLNGVITGLYSSTLERTVRGSVLTSLFGSLSASAVYIAVDTFVQRIPLIGHYPLLLFISALGISLSVYFAYFSTVRSATIRLTTGALELEFYADSLEEADSTLTRDLADCKTREMRLFGEDRASVIKECGRVVVEYEAWKEGGKVKVRARVHENRL